ncbi:hypothetical protein GF377_08125 [candidate division GN15 bacterium]|nr:hypothetical protein [candidate division GN15 bacterium]
MNPNMNQNMTADNLPAGPSRPTTTNPNESWAKPTEPAQQVTVQAAPSESGQSTDEASSEAVSLLKIEQQADGGANWFFWIAGLSVVNSIIALIDLGIVFPVGLGITQIIDGFALAIGSGSQIVALGFGLVAASIFVFFGVMARKRLTWAFITGMILYAADALLFLLVMDVLSIGFHVWGCIGIYSGLSATKQLLARKRPQQFADYQNPSSDNRAGAGYGQHYRGPSVEDRRSAGLFG